MTLGAKLRGILVGASAVFLALVCVPSDGGARPLITGISDGGSIGIGVRTDFPRVADTGARMVRLTAFWQLVAPAAQPATWNPADPADPNYEWSYTDKVIRDAVDAGLTPMLQVFGSPLWADRCKRVADSGIPCNPDPGKQADFATALATRYSGRFGDLPRVRYFQAQNEPNLYLYFRPQFRRGRDVSPALYRVLLNRFYSAVKAVDPTNLVVTAGLAPLGRPHKTISPLRFMRELLCMRGRRHPRATRQGCRGGVGFDVFVVHPYTTGGPTHRPLNPDDYALGNLGRVRQLLRAAGRAGRIRGHDRATPFWVGEFSWDSKPPDPGGLPLGILRRWTSEAMYRSWKAGASRFFWLTLRDQARHGLPFDETYQAGLWFRGPTLAKDRPKPNLAAFRFPFVAFRHAKGIAVWGRTPDSSPAVVSIEVKRGRHWRVRTSLTADRDGIFRGLIRTSYGRDERGFVRAVITSGPSPPFSLHPVRDFYQPPFG